MVSPPFSSSRSKKPEVETEANSKRNEEKKWYRESKNSLPAGR
jgi:hypothetical protein